MCEDGVLAYTSIPYNKCEYTKMKHNDFIMSFGNLNCNLLKKTQIF